MRVPDTVLKTAVFLGVDSKDGRQYKATGYIVSTGQGQGHTIKQQVGTTTLTTRYPRMFLVTAAHVAEKLEKYDFYIRANKKDGTVAEIQGDCSTRWWYHPTEREAVDAALMMLSVEEVMSLDIAPIPITIFVNDESIAERNLGIGDEVFVAGNFVNVQGETRNIPIVRTGNVAMMPNEKILFAERWIYAHLVESRSIGGLSGSPVFIRETLTVDAGRRFDSAFRLTDVYPTPDIPGIERLQLAGVGKFLFFGSLVGHWDGKEAVNMGISPMVPAQKIMEVIMQDELLQEINKSCEEQQARIDTENGKAVLDVASDAPFTKKDFEAALKKASRKTK